MKILHVLQILWATILLVISEAFVISKQTWLPLAWFVVAALYLWACLSARHNGRLAWRTAAFVPALVCTMSMPWVAYCAVYMVWFGYQPILMTFAAFCTAVFLLPSLVLMTLIWHYRAEVFARRRVR